MLDTLLRIGEWQSKGKTEIDKELLRINTKSEKAYILEIVLDLDQNEIVIDGSNLRAFDPEKSPKEFLLLKTFSARHQKVYLGIDYGRVHYLSESLWGEKENEPGDFIKHIDNNYPELKTTKFYDTLNRASILKGQKEKISISAINESFKLSSEETIAAVCLSVIDRTNGIRKKIPFNQVDGFNLFVKTKYLKTEGQNGLCYASNLPTDDIITMSIDDRNSMLKMFQGTTLNYSSGFEKDLSKNFQISQRNLSAITEGALYVKNNLRVNIAGVPHLILPEFPTWDKVDIDLAIKRISLEKDLLFSSTVTRDLVENYTDWSGQVFWLNYITIQSTGQYFKTINQIKDVSEPFIKRLLNTFIEVDWWFRDMNDVDWGSIMNDLDGKQNLFNFYTIYKIVPQRKEESTNASLQLFKSIFEQNKIEIDHLFKSFSKLMLCHYYARYVAYSNVKDYSIKGKKKRKDYFHWAIRDSVFKYLAFIQVLKNLKLVVMEEPKKIQNEEPNFGDRIKTFFIKMNFSSTQKALFYLGRMINDIVWLQEGKNKTVLDKLNYNGMSRDHIERLSNDLCEKRLQYRGNENKKALNSFDLDHSCFKELFDYNDWLNKDISEEAALFFILTGYSFGKASSK